MKNQYAILMKEMLELQDSINSLINNEWRNAHNPWYRAIWTECAELMDHIGWKWWKKQEIDIEQAQIELIDIFRKDPKTVFFGTQYKIIYKTNLHM